jgi:hypothetical protein
MREYAERRSEAAFAKLVQRHVDLVYSAVLRMVCDSHLAEDVTQGTFVALSRSAPQLTDRAIYGLPSIIRLSKLAVMRCTRGSSLLKSRRGGFISPGGVERTMFHQQVPASKTMLPFGNS